jgi:hypothetical protein
MRTRRPAFRAAARFVAVTLGVVALLVAAAWVALAVLLPHDRVLALVRAQLAASLRREARLADVSVGLWPPVRIEVRGLEIAEPGGFARGAALKAASLDLDLDVPALLSRRIAVRSLTLERPSLHLVLRADGTTNLDSLFAGGTGGAASGKSGAPMDLAVRTFVIRGGEVLVDDLGPGRRVHAGLETRLSLTARGGSLVATKGSTRIERVAFGPLTARRPSDLDPALAKLACTIEHDGRYDAATRTLELGSLTLGLGRARLGLVGTVRDPGPRATLDLRARGERLDLGEVLGYVAAVDARALNGITGGGRLAFDLRVAGRLGPGERPVVTGTLAVVDGSFRYPGAALGVDGLAFTASLAPDGFAVNDLRVRVGGQPLRAQLAVDRYADPRARFALKGSLDLAALSQALAPKDTKVAGRGEVNVRGSGRLRDPGSFVLDGSAALANGSIEGPALPRRVDAISASVQLAPERATVRGLTARAGKSTFTLDASLTRPLALMSQPGAAEPAGVTFTFRSPWLDLAELLPPGPGGPLAFNARGGGRVEIARFRNQRLDVEDVVANVALSPAVIAVPSFVLCAYGGTVTGRASFGFRDPANPSFAVAGRADTVRVDQVLSAWSPARGVLTGVASSDFALSGDGVQPEQLRTSLSALGLALLAEGRLSGPVMDAIAQATRTPALREVTLRDLRLPFRVERGRVVTDSVRFGGSPGASGYPGEWRMTGMVGFDGSLDYAVSATLPPSVAGGKGWRDALAAGLLSDGQGRLLVDLRVGGTAKAPRVTLDTKSVRDRLAGRATEALREQRVRLGETLLRAGARAGPARDSSRASDAGAPVRELQQQGRDLLRGLLGRKGTTPPDSARR